MEKEEKNEDEGYVLYILELEDDCYYVGKTKNLEKRLDDHFRGDGCSWTKEHRMKSRKSYKDCKYILPLLEDYVTKLYMFKYGIDKVRGGAYTQVLLDDLTIEFLEREQLHEDEKCFKCGMEDHFAKDCPNLSHNCHRCGREYHDDGRCTYKKDVNGERLI